MKQEFYFTDHALDRLYERHGRIFKDPKEVDKQKRLKSAYAVLDDAVEDRSFINNTARMVFLHEKYGYDRQYKIFINRHVLFIGVIEKNKKVIITTLDLKNQRW